MPIDFVNIANTPPIKQNQPIACGNSGECPISIENFLRKASTDRVARAWARSVTAEMHSGFSTIRQECGMNFGVRIQLHQTIPALQADIDRLNEIWTAGLDYLR